MLLFKLTVSIELIRANYLYIIYFLSIYFFQYFYAKTNKPQRYSISQLVLPVHISSYPIPCHILIKNLTRVRYTVKQPVVQRQRYFILIERLSSRSIFYISVFCGITNNDRNIGPHSQFLSCQRLFPQVEYLQGSWLFLLVEKLVPCSNLSRCACQERCTY